MGYVFLAVAIIADVIGTNALNLSQGFSRWLPSVIAVCCYTLALYCLSLTLRTVPMGIAYAVWAGSGIALIALSGAVFFKQIPDLAGALGIVLIITGVVLVTVISRTGLH